MTLLDLLKQIFVHDLSENSIPNLSKGIPINSQETYITPNKHGRKETCMTNK